MKFQSFCTVPTAKHVLALASGEVPMFVEDCVKTRSLSSVISDLNEALLFGAEEEKREAHSALTHLGFL